MNFKRYVLHHGVQAVTVDERPASTGACAFCTKRTLVRLTKIEFAFGVSPEWALTCQECTGGCDCDDVASELANELLELMGESK
jgi:hypothetical protein